MLKDSFLFELKYRLKSPGTWLCLLGLVFMAYREMLAGEWDLLVQSGRVARNSPYTVYYLFMYYTFWTATIGSALVIPTLLRDLKSGTAELLYSFPLHSRHYFIGKYLAMMIILVLVMSSVAIGFITMPHISTALGIHPATDFTATPWQHIAHAFLIWVLPGCFVYGSLIFAVTALTGRAGPAYAIMMLAVGLFVMITAIYGDGAPHSNLVQILDPLGKVTVEGQIYYWTAEERMEKFLSFEGELLQNRLLYMGIATLLLVIAWLKFDLRRLWQKNKSSQVKINSRYALETIIDTNKEKTSLSASINITNHYTYWLQTAFSLGWQLFCVTISNKAFYLSIITLILMLILSGWSYTPVDFEGTGQLLPATFIILPGLMYPTLIFTLVGAAFFSIELCEREKSFRVQQLVDACPVPTWSLMLSKLIGVLCIAISLTLIPVIAILLIQWGKGYFATNWWVMAHISLLVILPIMLIYVLISIICYGFLHNKALSQGVAIIVCITPAIFNEVKTIENFMYLWAWPFPIQLSDFAASTQFLQRDVSFAIYWLSLYTALTVVAYWLWPRGTTAKFFSRLSQILPRIGPVSFVLFVVTSSLFVWSVFDIYNGMIVRNQYKTDHQQHSEQADYAKKYAVTRSLPQPKIQSAELSIELYPNERKAHYSAELTLINKTDKTIKQLYLQYPEFADVESLSYQQQAITPVAHDKTHRRITINLPTTLLPKQTEILAMDMQVDYQGFHNDEDGYHGTIVKDGSYFPHSMWPSLGYDRDKELKSTGLRKEYNLGSRKPIADVNAALSVVNFGISDDADFLANRIIRITADSDHIAVAPGEIIEESVNKKTQRKTTIYQSQQPSLWDIHLTSGRYQTANDIWQAGDKSQLVKIEIFHHPKHNANIDRLISSAKQALTKAYSHWGAFPYKTLRIAEIPKDISESQVSGNLIIIPENKAWLHDYREAPDFDWIHFQLARDISRIWWQQVAIANVQGKSLFYDAIPTLYGLKAIEAQSGSFAVNQFIQRISSDYLRDRTNEDQREASLLQLADEKYAKPKSILGLYSIYQLLGEEHFSKVVNQYFTNNRLKDAVPYANADDLKEQFIQAAPTYYMAQQLDSILTETRHYDFRVKEADLFVKNQYEYFLEIDLSAKEYQYQSGVDVSENYNGLAKIWVFSEEDKLKPTYQEEVLFNAGAAQLRVQLNKKPVRVIVNPQRSLLERSPNDNEAYVTQVN